MSLVTEESNSVTKDILGCLKLANQSKYRKVLGGGNCGMFAYAVAKFLNEKYGKNIIELEILSDSGVSKSLIGNGVEGKQYKTISDMIEADASVYHICLDYDGTLYDETGKIDDSYLTQLALDQYSDHNPLISKIYANNNALKLIRNNTNWNIPWEDFYMLFKDKKPIKETITETHEVSKLPHMIKVPRNQYDFACPHCKEVMREKDFSFKYIGEGKGNIWTHKCNPDMPFVMPERMYESRAIKANKSGFSKDETEPPTLVDKDKVKNIVNDKKLPDVAEDGKAYVVVWADGRGVFACNSKKYLTKWLNDVGSWAEIISIKYGEPKHDVQKLKILKENFSIVESLGNELREIFSEGMVKVPTAEVRRWVDDHIKEFELKLKETISKGYNTYIDDDLIIKNPYTNEDVPINVEIQKNIISSNEGGSLLRYDIQNNRILVSAINFFNEYKKNLKEGFISGIIHELVHAIDPGVANKKKKFTPGSYKDIVNSDIETVAFNREYIDRIKHMPEIKQKTVLDNIRKGKSLGIKDADEYYTSLTPKNKNKFISQLYKELTS